MKKTVIGIGILTLLIGTIWNDIPLQPNIAEAKRIKPPSSKKLIYTTQKNTSRYTVYLKNGKIETGAKMINMGGGEIKLIKGKIRTKIKTKEIKSIKKKTKTGTKNIRIPY